MMGPSHRGDARAMAVVTPARQVQPFTILPRPGFFCKLFLQCNKPSRILITMPATTDKTARGVQCLDRSMDILEAIATAGEMGVTQIAAAVGLHVATVHNILRTLAARHYLINAGGRYRLGPGLAALTARWDPLQALPAEIKPYLEQISAATGEAASATILVGYSGRLIGFQPGTQPITIQFPQWEWPNAMSLATGRLLVSFLQPKLWREFITRNAGAEPYWSIDRWEQELTQWRSQGCCVLRRPGDDSQTAIACPIRTAGGAALAAIGASAPGFRADPALCQRMLVAVHTAAQALSRHLGWEGPDTEPPTIRWS